MMDEGQIIESGPPLQIFGSPAQSRTREFLSKMLAVAARVPDAAARDQFADRIAFKARVTDEVVRAEIRKAVVQRATSFTRRQMPSFGQVTKAEKGVIWGLIHDPGPVLAALARLDEADLEPLASRSVLDLALKLNENDGFAPSVFLERLTMVEAQLVTSVASEPQPPTLSLEFCVRSIRKTRYERERAVVKREIERLQSIGGAGDVEVDALLARNGDLGRLIQALVISEE